MDSLLPDTTVQQSDADKDGNLVLFRVIDLGEQPDYEPRILFSMRCYYCTFPHSVPCSPPLPRTTQVVVNISFRHGFLEVSPVPAVVDVRRIQ